MTAPRQAPLFVLSPEAIPPLSEEEHVLVARFRAARNAQGAATRTIDAEVSQLRMLRRDLIRRGTGTSLAEIVLNPALAGALLMEPSEPCSKSTMETRFRAVHRLLQVGVSHEEGRCHLAALDAALSSGPSRGWHDAGIRVGGQRGRVVQRSTLDTAALRDILHVAEAESVESGALAGFLCCSALSLDSICALRWGDVTWGADRMSCTVSLGEGRGRRDFEVIGPAPGALIRLHISARRENSDFVFPGRKAGTPITTRAARERLTGWAARAGLVHVTRHGLASALAESLRAAGVDDPSTQLVLGRRQVRSVDRLLAPHVRLESQRRVQAALTAMLAPHAGQTAPKRGTNSTY